VTSRRVLDLLFLSTVPLFVFLLLGEIGLRVYLSRNIFYDVEMSRYALTLKQDSPNPKIGHHHRPSSEATLMGVRVATNADGFRDDEYPVERGERRRVLFLGDSLTLGWGVEKEETFEHRLEQALHARTPTEVINLGVGNYNTTQEVNLLIDKGLAYAPDAVVLFYFINDAEPVPQKSRFPGLGRSRMVTFYWSRLKALKARLTPTAGFETYYAALYDDDAPGWIASRQALGQLAGLAREHRFDLRVVLLPELHDLANYPFAREHALVLGTLAELRVPSLDLAPLWADEQDPQSLWVARDDAHPNARAHAWIAEHTLAFIREGEAP
jgi:lysophospholipase L1-like esterase